jgi:hypothetical protein
MFKSPCVWCPVFITGTKIYFFRSMLQSVSISTFRLIKRGSCVGTVHRIVIKCKFILPNVGLGWVPAQGEIVYYEINLEID